MKIDEACIDHNAVMLINELTQGCYDTSMSDEKTDKFFLYMTLGNIIGVLDMARAMKEVLKC